MQVKIVKKATVPARSRKQEAAFELTPAWKSARALLNKGLPTKDDSISIAITPEDLKAISHRRNVIRFLQKYIKENELPLRVRGFNSKGLDYVVIER